MSYWFEWFLDSILEISMLNLGWPLLTIFINMWHHHHHNHSDDNKKNLFFSLPTILYLRLWTCEFGVSKRPCESGVYKLVLFTLYLLFWPRALKLTDWQDSVSKSFVLPSPFWFLGDSCLTFKICSTFPCMRSSKLQWCYELFKSKDQVQLQPTVSSLPVWL